MNAVAAMPQFRVWIVTCENWQPQSPTDVPRRAVALEPAEEAIMSAEEAEAYRVGFNQLALDDEDDRWAIAVPVRARYEGDLTPGEVVGG